MARKQAMGAGLRYVGQEFIVGVPARDLTAEEAALYAAQINENETATGRALYVGAEAAAPTPVTPVTEVAEGGGNG